MSNEPLKFDLLYRPNNIGDWNDFQEWKPTYIYKYIYDEPKEKEDMPPTLVQQYRKLVMSKDEKKARIWGAIDENGKLTDSGRELLLEILWNDPDIKKRLFEAIKMIDEDNPVKQEEE